MSLFKDRHTYLWISVWVVILSFVLRFSYIQNDYFHPDEIIPAKVIAYMHATGNWDTNWKNAGLPDDFNYDQYNFSSYIYTLYVFSRLIGSFDLYTYRLFSVICSTIAVIMLLLLSKRIQEPAVVVSSGFVAAIAPLLVQDAHYARPEAFVTCLTLLVIYLCWGGHVYSSYFSSAIIGFLSACKITMLFFCWLPLLPLIDTFPKKPISVRKTIRLLFAITLLMMVGFFIGVPGALKNPHVYINGIKYLSQHYSKIHPGHSHISGGPVVDFLFGYLISTLSFPMLFFFLVGCYHVIHKRLWKFILLMYFPPLFFIGYFSYQSVFFERNLSHIILLYIVGSVYGMHGCWIHIKNIIQLKTYSYALLIILFVWMSGTPLYYTYRLVFDGFSGKLDNRIYRFYRESIWSNYREIPLLSVDYLFSPEKFGEIEYRIKDNKVPFILHVYDPGDEITESCLIELNNRFDIIEINRFDSIFKRIPNCTLHTYTSLTHHFFLVSGFR